MVIQGKQKSTCPKRVDLVIDAGPAGLL